MIKGSCHCGAVSWIADALSDSATACNCTVCRRYGVLWAYGTEKNGVELSGGTTAYTPADHLEFHFCSTCGCLAYWRTRDPGTDGRYRVAVNLRLAEPESVAPIPIRRFDGLEHFKDLPGDGRRVADYWA